MATEMATEPKKKLSRKAKSADQDTAEKKAGGSLSVVKTFRIDAAVAADLDREIEKFGGKVSEYLRARLIDNKIVIKGVEKIYKESPCTLEYVRLLNKQSNNINQLAKGFHQAKNAGEIGEETYKQLLIQLQEISTNSRVLLTVKMGG